MDPLEHVYSMACQRSRLLINELTLSVDDTTQVLICDLSWKYLRIVTVVALKLIWVLNLSKIFLIVLVLIWFHVVPLMLNR